MNFGVFVKHNKVKFTELKIERQFDMKYIFWRYTWRDDPLLLSENTGLLIPRPRPQAGLQDGIAWLLCISNVSHTKMYFHCENAAAHSSDNMLTLS